jgi:tetratricopeptide (TPR) repeat protein
MFALYCRTLVCGLSSLLLLLPLPVAAAPFDALPREAAPNIEASEPSTGQPDPSSGTVRVVPPEFGEAESEDVRGAAIAAFQAGDEAKCLSLLRDAVAENPNIGPPELTLAVLHLKQGDRNRALQLLEKVAAEDNDHPLLHLTFAQLALAEHRLTEAQMHYQKLEENGLPANWKEQDKNDLAIAILAGKATVAERRGNWEEAQKTLAQWLKLHADNPILRFRWGKALLNAGKESKAYEQFDIAYRQDNTLNRPEAAVGAEYTTRGEFAKANRWFAKALEAYPNDSSVHYAWAMSLLFQDRADEVDDHVRLAGAQGFETNKLDMLRGVVARTQGKHEQAAKHFAQVLKRAPDDREASYQLVLTWASTSDLEARRRALQLAASIAKAHPQSPTAIAALGIAQDAAGNSEEALKTLAPFARMSDARPEVLLVLGRLLDATDRHAEAQRVAARLREQMDAPGIFVERGAAAQWLAQLAKPN